jgi:hypothetical protein
MPIEAELIKQQLGFVLPTHHRAISHWLKTEPNEPRRIQDFFNGIF